MVGNCSEEGEVAKTTRIFVGGLKESVTEDDVGKMFTASLGRVKAIDFVRTKGRSFAYVDFLPSSCKSLPKLFSTYNGCVWKGGRLRLEKAREHYLVRLKRELAEDTELAHPAPSGSIDAYENIASAENSKEVLNSGKTQLRIFFPRLKKVKSLPFSGTGKHRYSFQRVEVPPLPINFCDCEEHSVASHTAKENYFCDPEAQDGGMDEKELKMMNLVINKLFEWENISKAASSRVGFVEEGSGSFKSTNDALLDDNEASCEADEDNLIVNMVTRRDKRMALSGSLEGVILSNQEAKFNQLQISKGDLSQDMLKVHERDVMPSNKKRKLLISEKFERNESDTGAHKRRDSLQIHTNNNIHLEPLPLRPELGANQSATSLSWSQKSSWKELVGDKGKSVFSISHVVPFSASSKAKQRRLSGLNLPDSSESKNQNLENHAVFRGQSSQWKDETLVAPQPSEPIAVNKSARGPSWLQKSSWTELVGEKDNSSFSISHILPGIGFERKDSPRSNGVDVADSTDSKHSKSPVQDTNDASGDGSRNLGLREGLFTAASGSVVVASHEDQNPIAVNVEKNTVNKNMEAPALRKNGHLGPERILSVDVRIGEACSFMRSTASVREWVDTKAALSGSAKRKHYEK